jgi:hypothetical protein
MKSFSNTLLIIIILALPSSIYAQELKSIEQTKELATKATNLFGERKLREGFTVLKKYWPLPESEIENLINQTEMQWTMVDQRFGKPISVEFVREEKIASSFIKYLFIQKFENHAIRWEIIFYKPKRQWKVNNIKWDDDIKQLFTN